MAYEIKPLEWSKRDDYMVGVGMFGRYHAFEFYAISVSPGDDYQSFHADSIQEAMNASEQHHQSKLLLGLIEVKEPPCPT